MSFSQKYRIAITINVENCTNIRAKFFSSLCELVCTSCYYDFNPCFIFEKMVSFSLILNLDLEQEKLMAAVNFWK